MKDLVQTLGAGKCFLRIKKHASKTGGLPKKRFNRKKKKTRKPSNCVIAFLTCQYQKYLSKVSDVYTYGWSLNFSRHIYIYIIYVFI